MADVTEVNYRQPDGSVIIIYSTKEHGVYAYEDIFDPLNPESGKYFPALNSIVIKSDGSLWYVSARDEATYSVTLSTARIITTADDSVTVSNYGNDKYGLYVDKRVAPMKLMVDAKIVFVGNNLVEYTLHRKVDGVEQCVSMYYDSTGKFISTRIPLTSTDIGNLNIKFPTNCHTTFNLDEDEEVTMKAYDNLGNQVAEVVLYVHEAYILNDLNSQLTPIASMGVESTQMRGDDLYIYEHQEPEELNIRPYLLHTDGTKSYLNVDNESCFIYGLEDFIPSFPGYFQKLVFKYFLNHKESSLEPQTESGPRVVTTTKNLVVVAREAPEEFSVKLSVIPKFYNGSWFLRFFAYTLDRDHCYDVTDCVKYTSEEYPFDSESSSWGHMQHLQLSYNLQSIFNTTDEILGTQDLYITLWDGASKYAKYTFSDKNDSDAVVYGAESSVIRRPVIHYDEATDMYFIPSTIFGNWAAVVEAFYTQANPLFNPVNESVAPTPTHFIIRDSDNAQMIVGGSLSADNYQIKWSTIPGTPNLVGQTVVVEFLRERATAGTYDILYGVPVDVVKSSTGYNTEEN